MGLTFIPCASNMVPKSKVLKYGAKSKVLKYVKYKTASVFGKRSLKKVLPLMARPLRGGGIKAGPFRKKSLFKNFLKLK